MKNRRQAEAGFTLVEVLVVIFILSVIMALVIPNYTQSSDRAQKKLCLLNQENLKPSWNYTGLTTGSCPMERMITPNSKPWLPMGI